MQSSRVCLVAVAVLGVASAPGPAGASYAIYVGKNLTEDGSVLLGGTGEEVSSHWLQIVPRRSHEHGGTFPVGVTGEADLPGKLIEIPQAAETFRYLTMNYTDFKGLPPPLTNGGMNEYGVAVRDVWSTSRRELVEMTPNPQRGLNYSDLARIMLERARTAREAVEILGRLIDEYGYATYGGNSHLIADAREGWVVLEMAGGKGLWVAERLGPDEVRVSYPGYIGDVPKDYLQRDDFMGSKNLISFAVKQGWYDPASGEAFNVHRVYGLQGRAMRSPGLKFVDQKTLEEDLRAVAPVSVAEMMAAVRDYRIADDEAGYGQVAHLRPKVRADLRLLWVAPTGSITAPFIPYWIGVQKVPPEYRQHRYLTRGSGSNFLSQDYAAQEGTEFSARLFKRLMYFTCEHPDRFLSEVTEAFTAFEARMLADQPKIERTAELLFAAGQPELAREYLTRYSNEKAREALELGHALLASVEARTRVIYGIRKPSGEKIHAGHGPDRKTVNCRDTMKGEPSTSALTAALRSDRATVPRLEVPELALAAAPATEPQDDGTPGWIFGTGLVIAALIGVAIGRLFRRRESL